MVDTAALRRLAEEGGWRSDMENAPKDEPFLAMDSGPFAYVAEWNEKLRVWIGGDNRAWTPTHWKPLDTPDTPDATTAALNAAADEIDRLREALGHAKAWLSGAGIDQEQQAIIDRALVSQQEAE